MLDFIEYQRIFKIKIEPLFVIFRQDQFEKFSTFSFTSYSSEKLAICPKKLVAKVFLHELVVNVFFNIYKIRQDSRGASPPERQYFPFTFSKIFFGQKRFHSIPY